RLNIKYLIGGSIASAIHGEPRSTLDIDMLADIEHEQVDEFCQSIASSFYVSKESILEALEKRTSFHVIHFESVFKVDVFIPKNRSFEKREFERRALVVVAHDPEKTVWVASAEDIILSKLEWYRQGNEISDRQWRDIVGIF